MSLSQSTLYTSFLKRSAPETHDADDGTSNVVHPKKKKSQDNKTFKHCKGKNDSASGATEIVVEGEEEEEEILPPLPELPE